RFWGNQAKLSSDPFVAKFDATGERIWASMISEVGDDFVGDLATDSEGRIYLGGHVGEAVPSGSLWALDPNGGLLWQRHFGSGFSTAIASVANGPALSFPGDASDGTTTAVFLSGS